MYRFYKSYPCNLLYYNELQGVLFRLQIWISLTLLPNFALLEFHEYYLSVNNKLYDKRIASKHRIALLGLIVFLLLYGRS